MKYRLKRKIIAVDAPRWAALIGLGIAIASGCEGQQRCTTCVLNPQPDLPAASGGTGGSISVGSGGSASSGKGGTGSSIGGAAGTGTGGTATAGGAGTGGTDNEAGAPGAGGDPGN